MPSTLKIKVNGIVQLFKNVEKTNERMGEGLQKGLMEAGHELKKDSNAIAPLEEGTLINDSFVHLEGRGIDSVVTIGYGPPNSRSAEYALRQHEENNKKKGGRRWQYLADPVKQNKSRYLRIIRSRISEKI